jgi:hypothetical protein
VGWMIRNVALVAGEVSVESLGRVLDPASVAAAVACGGWERRRRKLPAGLVLLVCVAMNLYAAEALPEVVRRLTAGALRASKAGLCRARYRLGARPAAALFRRVCRPLATAATPGAFLFGHRLVAVDAALLDVADTPDNARAFGRPASWRGPGAWPQAQVVALVECGTHAVFDAGVWPRWANPHAAARRLLRSVERGMLLLHDRGLYSASFVQAVRGRGAHLLGRLPTGVHPQVLRPLTDGTLLVRLRPDGAPRTTPGVLARLVRYTLDDPARPGHGAEHRLVTTLLNPTRAPALDLACAYHARWEVELAVDELKTHQRPSTPLRSQKPVGVVQEVYGLLLAHYILRAVIADAAQSAGLAPTRLSFTTALRLVRTAVPDLQRASPCARHRLYRQLLADLAAGPLPPRTDRSNPRVVKQKMSNFPLKRLLHRTAPRPSRPFRDAVLLLK